jgi:hypothetical protein
MASTAVNIPGVAVREMAEVRQPVSWQEFESQYLGREDAFKYEWVISDNDIVDNLLDKLKDYHDANVEVIWLISPKLGQVHVYAGSEPAICTGAMICSAAPALPGFEMSANAIFEQPALPVEEGI